MNKKDYKELEIRLFNFEIADVLCASQDFIEGENGDDGEENFFE